MWEREVARESRGDAEEGGVPCAFSRPSACPDVLQCTLLQLSAIVDMVRAPRLTRGGADCLMDRGLDDAAEGAFHRRPASPGPFASLFTARSSSVTVSRKPLGSRAAFGL